MLPVFSVSEFYSKTSKIQIQLMSALEQLFGQRRQKTWDKGHRLVQRQERAMSAPRKCRKTNCTSCDSKSLQVTMETDHSTRTCLRDNDNDMKLLQSQATRTGPSDLRDDGLMAPFCASSAMANHFSLFYLDKFERTRPPRSWESQDLSDKRRRRAIPSSSSSSTYYFCLLLVGVLLLNSFLINSVEGCGPGRGVGRRRAPRKLTPLVYKQHVPNIPEHHTPASGSSEGPIRPDDQKRFKELVPNYNTDIIFRDDEGTGADRLMNLRCKDKLNTLAISVMNQWPGVKLRVIEGWDNTTGPQSMQYGNSLHYEGRAVDITTSDRDRSKLGMLARLAVEAGFDWVYYESKQYIHCSVKSDSSQGGRTGGCFSGNSTVRTRFRGLQRISSVVPGDELLTVDTYGQLTYSPVLLFLDRNQTEVREFLKITTASGHHLTITPSHLLYSLPDQIQPDYYETYFSRGGLSGIRSRADFEQELMTMSSVNFAKNVEIGDWLLLIAQGNVTSGIRWRSGPGADAAEETGTLFMERVVNIELLEETGVYAPLTATGTVVVDNVVSSCYAVVQSQSLAHWSFLPVRFLHNFSSGLSQLWKQFRLLVTLSSEPAERQGAAVFVDMVRTRIKSHENQVKALNAHDQGIHWYASMLYSLTSRFLPSQYLYGS